MEVEVVFVAADGRQRRIEFDLLPPFTVEHAIAQSGILAEFPEIAVAPLQAGIFGSRVALHRPVNPGERVEIYRQLKIDPKQARRQRAARDRRRRRE